MQDEQTPHLIFNFYVISKKDQKNLKWTLSEVRHPPEPSHIANGLGRSFSFLSLSLSPSLHPLLLLSTSPLFPFIYSRSRAILLV